MHTPYRNIVKSGETTKPDHRVAKKKRRRSIPTVPRSTVINFAAIALLFAVIFALQQIGNSLGREKSTVPAEPQAVTLNMEELETEVVATEAADTTETVAVLEKKSTNEATGATTAIVTLEEKKIEKKVETPGKAKKKVARKSVKRRRRATRKSTISSRDPYRKDRSMGVSELDNEFARERYNALNRKLSAEEITPAVYAETTTAPTYSYEYAAPTYTRTSSHSGVNDLDGESARQNYNAQNRELSGSRANLD